MVIEIQSTYESVSIVYEKLIKNVSKYRDLVGRHLTLSEKILAGHFENFENVQVTQEQNRYVLLRPDRVALQDVTGQMVMLQFMQAGLKSVTLPTTIHCDHLIQARTEGKSDTKLALYENNEVYKFLESAASKYGIGFWKPGAGIIHQVILENYAFPGGLMIGTDSHTPNAGGLGMLAIGVGGVDAAETMAGMPWELLYPKRIGVYLKGELNGWTAAKDVILYVAGQLSVSGGTNSIIEYFGPGTKSISCTGKATITNMGAEIGATCSIFPYDERMELYLKSTGRKKLADLANKYKEHLIADPDIEKNPGKYFDKVIEIDLSKLEPHVVGPHTPDLARPISKLADDVKNNNYLDNISVALIGSCTNSSYEDMSRAASLAKQAQSKGIKAKIPLLVTPGSEQIRATIERDGQIDSLKSIGATVLANACGPCIGQWHRPELKQGERNTIVTSYNRNFPGRNDGKRETMNFIASPEMVIALALGGSLSSDHISPAGPWLRFRGHLDKLSDNLLLGAVNAFNEQVGKAKNMLTNQVENCAEIARQYKKQNISWIIVGDENYGEGSSREHAAMTPRYLGCTAVIAKSFARIHETNLKKQGILALTFNNPEDYDKIYEDDKISISQLGEFSEGKPVECNILHANNTSEKIILKHSYNNLQIEWFRAGSAMNILRKKQQN